MIIVLGFASADNHIPQGDIFDYGPLWNVIFILLICEKVLVYYIYYQFYSVTYEASFKIIADHILLFFFFQRLYLAIFYVNCLLSKEFNTYSL